jgi:hypothetical protein
LALGPREEDHLPNTFHLEKMGGLNESSLWLGRTFSVHHRMIILSLLVVAIPLAFNFNLLLKLSHRAAVKDLLLHPLSSSSQDDPERIDCTELLNKFKADEIEVAKKEGNINFRRSYATISKGVPKPFYVATHDRNNCKFLCQKA